MTTTRLTSLLASLALVASLTACGGGSGGDTSTSTSPPTGAGPSPTPPSGSASAPADVVSSSGTLQTAASALSYAASSQQASFFNALNTARIAAGAGAVNQSTQLDAAAQAHATYLTTNQVVAHTEDSTKPDYYEATPSSRLAKAGFSAGYSTEVIGGTGPSMSAADCVLGLLNTVYHGAALLSQETYVGIGIGTDGLGVPSCVADLANPSTDTYGQVPASGKFIAYPHNGQTNVAETFYVAYETPRPSGTLFPNTTAGTPVIVRVRNADFLNFQHANTLSATVTKFELKDAGGNLVPAGILAASGLTGSGVTLNTDSQLGEGFAVLVPLSPLAKGATYTYTFTATLKVGGTPVTVTNGFTTNP
ncbi:CAP domain-containing protein [Roseateles sp.]|uniref:CAP domain-containing protein n=1 Tax=Roseateles sp. TaxID=1971397 RepID=UPI0031DAB412